MFSLIVFDLDGTLVDSRRDIAESANALLASCGGSPLPENVIGGMVGDGAAMLLVRAFERSGLARPSDALERYLKIYGERLLVHTQPYPGVREALSSLGSRARLAVLTNKPLAATRRILDGLDLWRHFDAQAVLGGDGPWPRKPDPAGLRHLMTWAGMTADSTVLVGDSLVDLRTARASRVRACLARYGFGFTAAAADLLTADDLVVDRAADLPQLL